MSDVNHPAHYNTGKIEVIEFIEDQKLNFSRGNAIKYIARAGKKVPLKCSPELALELEMKDLDKARFYITRELELVRAMYEMREPVRPNDMNPREKV